MSSCSSVRFVCALILLTTCSLGFAEDPVYFADLALKTAVEEVLEVEEPTPSDMIKLTCLGASERGITNLTGLEYAIELDYLELTRNQITDLRPLSGLTNLTVLYLNGNQINSLVPLSGLTNLTYLDLSWNSQITDLLPLSTLVKLRDLHVGWCSIDDISPLSTLMALESFSASENQIVNIGVLSGLKSLTHLALGLNQINDISPLAGLNSLQQLYLGSQIGDPLLRDITDLSGLTHLSILYLDWNAITNISALLTMENLTRLALEGNPLSWQAYCSDIQTIVTNNSGIELTADANPYDCGVPDEPVYFADEALKTAVIQALGLNRDPRTSDMVRLTSFQVIEGGITDLTGLEYAPNLVSLSLPNNAITDLSPLAGLASLDYLELIRNQISDVGPLAGLTNLTVLELTMNQISDLAGLSGLTNLTYLGLSFNEQIADLWPLSTLVNLRELHVGWCSITDISPLSTLTALRSLTATENQIVDIGVLSAMTNLTRLELPLNQISNISALAGLNSLQQLYLGSQIGDPLLSDITPLSTLTNLSILYLDYNAIIEVSALLDVQNLTRLALEANPLGWQAQCFDIPAIRENNPGMGLTVDPNPYDCDIPNLPVTFLDPVLKAAVEEALGVTDPYTCDMSRLTSFYAGNRGITNLAGLEYATNLSYLDLRQNQISNISALAGLTNLESLLLQVNQITDVSPLTGLASLRVLQLQQNMITDVSPLGGLTGLTDLRVWENQITDVSCLSNLTNLTQLHISRNPISDISTLGGLTNLTYLSINTSMVADISVVQYMTLLQELRTNNTQVSDISPLMDLTTLGRLHLDACPLSWESYCWWLPAIQAKNPGLVLRIDPNPYNCDCGPEPTPEGANVVVTPTDATTSTTPVTLTFEQVTEAGGTTLATSQSGPTPPEGFQLGDPATYYEITTTAGYTGLIHVCISYAGVSFTGLEEALRLYHYEGGAWVDCTMEVDTSSDIICGLVSSLSPFTVLMPSVVHVDIDVKPGSYPNSININGNGLIPVAILGSSAFDVQWIDVTSLDFAGLAVNVKKNGTPQCSVEDANRDGYPDLVCHFVDDTTTWVIGTTIAVLTGNLKPEFGETPIEGSDEIRIVP